MIVTETQSSECPQIPLLPEVDLEFRGQPALASFVCLSHWIPCPLKHESEL